MPPADYTLWSRRVELVDCRCTKQTRAGKDIYQVQMLWMTQYQGKPFDHHLVATTMNRELATKASELVGGEAVVTCDIGSREYNGKWYTDARLVAVEGDAQPQGLEGGKTAHPTKMPPRPSDSPPATQEPQEQAEESDLPF